MNTSRISYSLEVAERVKSYMVAQGVSVKELAEGANIPRATLIRRLAGASPFTLTELFDVTAYLGLSVTSVQPTELDPA